MKSSVEIPASGQKVAKTKAVGTVVTEGLIVEGRLKVGLIAKHTINKKFDIDHFVIK